MSALTCRRKVCRCPCLVIWQQIRSAATSCRSRRSRHLSAGSSVHAGWPCEADDQAFWSMGLQVHELPQLRQRPAQRREDLGLWTARQSRSTRIRGSSTRIVRPPATRGQRRVPASIAASFHRLHLAYPSATVRCSRCCRPHLYQAYLDAERRRHDTPNLTPRHWELLHSVAAGQLNAQIARRLDVSEGTVRTHLQNIYGRLTSAHAGRPHADGDLMATLPMDGQYW